MPFTLSHAAAALPFRKLNPVWPALVIGTFAPDLQYFIWITDEDRSGHHYPGILFFTLPLALLLLWIFEWWVKGPVIELLPGSVQCRLQEKVKPLSFRGGGRFASIVLWITFGIATHICWDWFTHPHTWITAHWVFFSNKLPIPFHAPMMAAKVLQHASTVLGIVFLGAWVVVWYRGTNPAPRATIRQFSPFRKVITVFTMMVIAMFAGYLLAIVRLSDHDFPVKPLVLAVTVFEAVTLVFSVLVVIYGLLHTLTFHSRTMPATRLGGPSG